MKRKNCSKCKKKKLITEFNKNRIRKDGYSNYCKICKKMSDRKWRKNNPNYNKQYRQKHKKQEKSRNKKHYSDLKNNSAWILRYYNAKTRCNNSKRKDYKNYGGRGIKFLMTLKDFKYLWFRDKAYNMKKPSIDRKDNDGNYTLKNCQFIEFSENCIKRRRTWKRKRNKI